MSSATDGRWLTDDPTDHGAWLWISIIIGLVLTTSAASYRFAQRWKSWTLVSYDDHLAALTFLLAITYFAVLLPALKHGLGKAQDEDNLQQLVYAAKYAFGSRVLSALTAGASQCSVLMTLLRIINIRRNSWICLATVAFSCTTVIATMLALGVSCNASSDISGIRNDYCPGVPARLTVIAVLSSISEVLPLCLAIYFFWQLHMSTERRWHAMLGYACRVANVILLAITTNLSIQFADNGETSIGIIPALITQTILVMSEFFCVVAIFLARAMNDFQTSGPSITLTSVRDHSSNRQQKYGSDAMPGNRMKLRSDHSANIKVEVSHGLDSDADSESSRKGIVRKIHTEIHSEVMAPEEAQRHQWKQAAITDGGFAQEQGERRQMKRASNSRSASRG